MAMFVICPRLENNPPLTVSAIKSSISLLRVPAGSLLKKIIMPFLSENRSLYSPAINWFE
jgi:hypothetical protein